MDIIAIEITCFSSKYQVSSETVLGLLNVGSSVAWAFCLRIRRRYIKDVWRDAGSIVNGGWQRRCWWKSWRKLRLLCCRNDISTIRKWIEEAVKQSFLPLTVHARSAGTTALIKAGMLNDIKLL